MQSKTKKENKTKKTQNTNLSRPGHINTVSTTETNFSHVPIFIKSPLHWFLYDSHKWPEFFLQCIPFFLTNSDIFLPYFILLKSFGMKVRSPHAISRPQNPSTSEDTKPNQGDDLVRKRAWDLSGRTVTKTLHSQCRGPGFDSWSGN